MQACGAKQAAGEGDALEALDSRDREIQHLRADRDRLVVEREEARAKSRSNSLEWSYVGSLDYHNGSND